MMKKINKNVIPLLVAVMLFFPLSWARADDWYGSSEGYFTVQDEYGQILFRIASVVYIDDEYISEDNKRYRIAEVDEESRRAVAQFVEDVPSLLLSAETMTDFAANQPTIAIYCTHSDESYEPTDGTESETKNGGVMDVAAQLESYLQDLGCNVDRSDANHVPHDAGAYRRSRSTAVQLMKDSQPNMLCDIHRDAIPPEDYEKTINGEEASRIRIVIGRSNQNKQANEECARKLKEIADEKYPGLIKDIYIGKGSYNQDLMPQAILFEVGTSTIDKGRAETSTKFLADVIATSLGVSTNQDGATKAPDQGQQSQQQGSNYQAEQQSAQEKAPASANNGTWKSILWIVIVLVAIGGITLLTTVRQGQYKAKVGGFFKEITGIGKKHGGDDPRNDM